MGCSASLDIAGDSQGGEFHWPAGHHRPLPPADVLEVIAEYACASVSAACALRATARGFRRALDTTVRRCTCATQPMLRGDSSGGAQGVLRLHHYATDLDAVRIAFTCDRFPRIARLVVVAFALDGAKDELREGGVCGPRPVDCSDVADDVLHFVSDRYAAKSRWGEAAMLSSGAVRDALVRCVVAARVSSSELLTPELCAAAEARTALCFLRRLAIGYADYGQVPPLLPPPNCVRLVAAVGPRLTHLYLFAVTIDFCPAVASCASLTRFEVRSAVPDPGTAAALVDALIASGAPLRRVVLDFFSWTVNERGSDDSLDSARGDDGSGDGAAKAHHSHGQLTRLLTAVPSIVDVAGATANAASLPADIVNRMEIIGDDSAPRRSRRIVAHASDSEPSPDVTVIVTDHRYGYAPDWDLEATFPNLTSLSIGHHNHHVVNLRLSSALKAFSCDFGDAERLGLLRQLADHGAARLPRLHTRSGPHNVTVRTPTAPNGAGSDAARRLRRDAAARRDRLVGFNGNDDGCITQRVEAALAELVAIETATRSGLAQRCVLPRRQSHATA